MSKPNKTATWYKSDKEIKADDHVSIVRDGTKHSLVYKATVLEDEAKYSIKIEGKESTCKLTVEGDYYSSEMHFILDHIPYPSGHSM